MHALFLRLLCLFITYISVFIQIPNLFDYYDFLISFEIREHDAHRVVLHSQDCFDFQYLLWFHIYFRIICSIYFRKYGPVKVKEEIEKVGLKLIIQKTKIMASGPITSWQIDGETMETLKDYFWAPKSLQMVTAAMKLKDVCSLEEKLWPT